MMMPVLRYCSTSDPILQCILFVVRTFSDTQLGGIQQHAGSMQA